ncbi:hypothetical protein C8J57DRAFT_1225992 [Mycena rebaudengoi]|nr:hypothetical protein C8J57DRAFT_1225992 [Mycena rebaudengoi]
MSEIALCSTPTPMSPLTTPEPTSPSLRDRRGFTLWLSFATFALGPVAVPHGHPASSRKGSLGSLESATSRGSESTTSLGSESFKSALAPAAFAPKGALGPTAANLPRRRKRSSVVELDLAPLIISEKGEFFAGEVPAL